MVRGFKTRYVDFKSIKGTWVEETVVSGRVGPPFTWLGGGGSCQVEKESEYKNLTQTHLVKSDC